MLQAGSLMVLVTLPALCFASVSPTYRSEQAVCDSDDDCDPDALEVCWRLYSGCYYGVCMCNPATHILQSDTGRCQIFRYGNEECTHDGMCMDRMACINSTCQCPHGEMSNEANFCIMPHHHLLGQPCKHKSDVCLQNTGSGYVSTDAWCAGGRCRCRPGLQQYEQSCVKPRVTVCESSYECQGGFICLDGYCSCPHNYWPVAHNTKCAKETAIVDLPQGAHCDEINEQKYCAAGLICHRCYSETHYKCVKYSLSSSIDTEYLAASTSMSVHKLYFAYWGCILMSVSQNASLIIYLRSSWAYIRHTMTFLR